MKKLLAALLAVAMIMSFALAVSAEETTEGYTAYLKYYDIVTNTVLVDGVTTNVNGSGTYTLSWDLPEGTTSTCISMLYVEIEDSYDVLSGWTLSDVQVSIDGQAVDVNTAGIYTYAAMAYDANYNLVATNNYTIELRNDVAGYSLSTGVGAVDANINATSNITVTFTLTAPVAEEPEVPTDTPAGATLDCTGWWTAHTEGVEVTEDGVEITFTNTTYASASANWNTALWVLYTANEAKVNGDGYVEYWVHRSDNYGWGNAGYYTAELPADTWLNTAFPDNLTANGILWEGAFEDGCWDNWVSDSQAGAQGTVTAKLVGSNAVITISYHGVTNTLTLPVDTSKPVYLSLTGEQCTLSNIVVTENEPEADPTLPKTGDSIAVFVALMAISAVGITVLSKKKEF